MCEHPILNGPIMSLANCRVSRVKGRMSKGRVKCRGLKKNVEGNKISCFLINVN